MSKKITGVTYQSTQANVDGFIVELTVGTILTFQPEGEFPPVHPKGVLAVSDTEFPVTKYKKLATALVANKLLKPTAKTFRLDKILGLAKTTKPTVKVKRIKAKKAK